MLCILIIYRERGRPVHDMFREKTSKRNRETVAQEDRRVGSRQYRDHNPSDALKESGNDFDHNLSIGKDNGEVHLFGKKATVIPKKVSFTVIATDSAGNSNELDVTVDLSLRESTDKNDQTDENESSEGTISALSLEQPEGIEP